MCTKYIEQGYNSVIHLTPEEIATGTLRFEVRTTQMEKFPDQDIVIVNPDNEEPDYLIHKMQSLPRATFDIPWSINLRPVSTGMDGGVVGIFPQGSVPKAFDLTFFEEALRAPNPSGIIFFFGIEHRDPLHLDFEANIPLSPYR